MSLSPAKERFALLMAQGMTQAGAARKIGRTPQTVCEWMKDAEVKARIAEFQNDIAGEAVQRLRSAALENVDVVLDIARNGGEPGQVSSRLKAAIWALDKVIKPQGVAAESEQAKVLRDVAAELETAPDEELEDLLGRGRNPTTP